MAKGSGPIQYNELFNNDVDAKLAELSGIVTKLDSEFQGLASTIAAMSGKISVNIKTTNTVLEKMATDMSAVDVAARGAGEKLHGFSSELDTVATKSKNLKDQQAGLNSVFNLSTASVDEIKARVSALTAEYNALGRATDADKTKLASLGKEVSALKTYVDPLITALNKTKTAIVSADGSYNQMSQRLAALKKELLALPNAFNPTTGALNKANKEAVALNKEINTLDASLKKADASMGMYGRNVGNYKSALGGVANQLTQFASSYLSIYAGIAATQKIISNNAEVSDSMADVMRTAQLTDKEVNKLVDSLKKIDTRTSLKGLLDIAVIGGQLGIAKDQLAGFTKAIDQLSVVLSGEIKGGAEEVATSLGKINGVFKVQQKEGTDVETSFNKTGSAILRLGQAGLATGEFLQDFSLRVAGVANTAKISLPTILAYGAVLEESGISAEVAGTALNRLIGNLASKRDKFFAIAKIGDATLTLKDFTKLINTDANAALQKFFKGLNAGGKDLTSFSDLLDEIKIKGGPAKNAIIALAQNQGLLNERVIESQEAYDKGTLSADQFAIKNDTLAGSIEKLGNAFTNISTSGRVASFFKGIIDGLTDATKYFASLINSKGWGEFWDRLATVSQRGEKANDFRYNTIPDAVNASGNSKELINFAQSTTDPKNNQYVQDSIQKQIAENQAALKTLRQTYSELHVFSKDGTITDYNKETLVSTVKYIVKLKEQNTELLKYANIKKEIKKEDEKPGSELPTEAETEAARKKAEAAARKAEEARKKAIKDADDLLKAQTKLNIAALEQKEISDLAGKSEEEQTQITIQFEKDKLKIITDGIDAREKLYKKGTVDYIDLEVEKANATTDAQEKIAKATEDGLKRQLALQEKYGKLRKDLLESQDKGAYAKAEFDITSKTYKGNPEEQESQKQDALYALRRDALMKEMSLVDVRNKTIKDANERELTSAKEKQDILNEIDQLGYENWFRLHEEQKKKLQEMFSYLRENNSIIGQIYGQEFGNLFDSLTTNLENLLNKTGNGIADWAETIKAGVASASASFKQGSEERIASLETEKQQQMDIAGSNAQARLAIEKAFNDRIRAEKIKQAKIDKYTAIFDIAINTAVAASKATAQAGIFGLPLAAVLIAFGAIQAGLVAAKPLPAFKTGTQYAPEGYARVGEEGAELIESRRGNMRIAHSDQVTYLERGDKVYTASQTRKILDTSVIDSNTQLHGRLATNLHNQSSERRIKEMSIAFRQDPEAIGEAVGRRIKGLPIHETHFDERGVSRFIRESGTRTKYLNDRTSLK